MYLVYPFGSPSRCFSDINEVSIYIETNHQTMGMDIVLLRDLKLVLNGKFHKTYERVTSLSTVYINK